MIHWLGFCADALEWPAISYIGLIPPFGNRNYDDGPAVDPFSVYGRIDPWLNIPAYLVSYGP
jgi:hypothetical protein